MSAPDTNIKKQERRHKTPLMAIKASIFIAILLLVGIVFYTVVNGDDGETPAVVDTVPTVDTTVDN